MSCNFFHVFSELGRIRALSTEQTNELQAQLMKIKGVKNKLEKELEKSQKALNGWQKIILSWDKIM